MSANDGKRIQLIDSAKTYAYETSKDSVYILSFKKSFGKPSEETGWSSKSSNKIYELEQIESIFPKNQFYDLIIDKLKENVPLQNNIKLDDPEYTAKSGKHYNFTKYSVPFDF